jgi:hypothetical protein
LASSAPILSADPVQFTALAAAGALNDWARESQTLRGFLEHEIGASRARPAVTSRHILDKNHAPARARKR